MYFFDSDERGVNQRLSEINQEINEILGAEDVFGNNGEVKIVSRIKLGSFIFTGEDNNLGKLEDILIPLMRNENEVIFDEAKYFIDNHFNDERLFPLKIGIADGNIVESRSTKKGDRFKFDEGKSLVGVVGQLQKSGASNVVCINYSDFLTCQKIESNPKCQEIVSFFTQFIDA